jgi:hypothetical protein
MVSGSAAGFAAESVVPAGGPARSGTLACPSGAVVIGFNAANGNLLCETGFATGATSWITGETVDAPGGRLNVFPEPGTTDAVAHRYTGTPMHSCAAGEFMTGFNAAANRFLCATFGSRESTRRRFVTRPTPRHAPRARSFACSAICAWRLVEAARPTTRRCRYRPAMEAPISGGERASDCLARRATDP